MRALTIPFILCFGLLVSACDRPSPETPRAASEDAIPPEEQAAAANMEQGTETYGLPAERQDTITIEGMPTPMTMKRFVAPNRFPLQFSTFYPEDMIGQVLSSGEGEVARFTANFGGTLQNNAILQFFTFPVETTREDARILTQSEVENHAEWRETSSSYPWALYTWAYSGHDLTGETILGEHAGRFYQIQIAHPPEMGDGFAPRAEAIIRNWQWRDNEEVLTEGTGR